MYSAIANTKFAVVSDEVENLKKTKDVLNFINLLKEKNIVNGKKILFVVKDNDVTARNIDFIKVRNVLGLQVNDFVLGSKLIDNVLWTKKAIEIFK